MFRISQIVLLYSILFFACQSNSSNNNEVELSDEQLKEKAKELALKYIILDGHVDLPYRMEVKGFMLRKQVEDVTVETEGNFDYPKSKKGGLDAPFMSIYVPSRLNFVGAREFADSLIDMTTSLADKYPTKFALAGSPSDIKSNFDKGLISLPLGMENGAPIGSDLKNVEYFYKRGIRYITLTHSKDNLIADSSYDTTYTWNGLSPFGEQVIAEMNRVGIMVDISHVSDSAFYDALRLSKAPVMASHSSCRFYTPDFKRNMTDEMIKDLAKAGGVVLINFGSTFLSKESREKFIAMDSVMTNYRAESGLSAKDSTYLAYAKKYASDNEIFEDVKMVAEHIDHVRQIAGIDYVGFGSDFDGVGNSLPTGLKDVSMYPNVIYELLKLGYSDEDIEKVCSKNAFRVWDEVIMTAEKIQTN